MDKYRITLTVEERTGLEQLVSGGKSAARKLTHARILLWADEWQGAACSDTEIGSALGGSLRPSERVRQRCVTEGCAAALAHRPHPPRPDKSKLKGNVEQKLLEVACSEPPRGRCHWTLPRLAADLIVVGLVDTLSTVTVWPALKTMPATRGSSRPGVSRPRRTPSTYGAGRTCFRPLCGRTIRATPLCASLKRASNWSARCDRRTGHARAGRPGSSRSLSARASAPSC
jgi:hypothetical protein